MSFLNSEDVGREDINQIKNSTQDELDILSSQWIEQFSMLDARDDPIQADSNYERILFTLIQIREKDKEAFSSFSYSLVKNRPGIIRVFNNILSSNIRQRINRGAPIMTGLTSLHNYEAIHTTLQDELVSQGHQVAGTRKKRRKRVSRNKKKGGRRVSKKRRKSSKKNKRKTNKSRRRRK